MAFTKPQQWKREESERLRREGDKIKFIDLRFKRGQAAGFGKGRRRHHWCKLMSNRAKKVITMYNKNSKDFSPFLEQF